MNLKNLKLLFLISSIAVQAYGMYPYGDNTPIQNSELYQQLGLNDMDSLMPIPSAPYAEEDQKLYPSLEEIQYSTSTETPIKIETTDSFSKKDIIRNIFLGYAVGYGIYGATTVYSNKDKITRAISLMSKDAYNYITSKFNSAKFWTKEKLSSLQKAGKICSIQAGKLFLISTYALCTYTKNMSIDDLNKSNKILIDILSSSKEYSSIISNTVVDLAKNQSVDAYNQIVSIINNNPNTSTAIATMLAVPALATLVYKAIITSISYYNKAKIDLYNEKTKTEIKKTVS